MKNLFARHAKIVLISLILIVLVVLLILLAVFRMGAVRPYATNDRANASSTSLSAASTTPDSFAGYPLYEGIGWSAAQAATLQPYNDLNPTADTLQGSEIVSEISATTSDISALTQPFRTQYNTRLVADGWNADPALEADGAGSSEWGYRKGSDIILLSYRSDFINTTPDAPAECPCTITFKVFAGSIAQ